MTLTSDGLIENAFVVSIDNERFLAFKNAFEKEKLKIPKKFHGYEISDSFFLNYFHTIYNVRAKFGDRAIEQDLKSIHSICNNASHFSIVQYAKILEWPYVTIFEDDALPIDDCKSKIDKLCVDVPDDIDVLRLGYSLQFKTITNDAVISKSISHSNNLIVKNVQGSHAYVVFKRYYDRFIMNNKNHPRCDFININPSFDKNVFALKESLFNQINLLNRPVIHSWKLPDGKVIVNK